MHPNTRGSMKNLKSTLRLGVVCVFLSTGFLPLHAQAPQEPKQIVRSAMRAKLSADLNDHSRWKYRDVQKDGIDTVSIVVETDHGSVKRLVSRGGRPLSDLPEAPASRSMLPVAVSWPRSRTRAAIPLPDCSPPDSPRRPISGTPPRVSRTRRTGAGRCVTGA